MARRFSAFVVASALLLIAPLQLGLAVADDMRIHVKRGMAYDDVKMDLEIAIEGKGLKIGALSDLADMLERTRTDLNAGAPVYKSAHYVQFCSAAHAHKLTAADPANIGNCPFLMFIYETIAKPGEVVVGYRPVVRSGSAATRAALDDVEALLESIARDTVR